VLRFFGKELLRYLPAQLLPALLSLASIPIFTRVLAPEQFGRYALVMSSVTVMMTLLDWLSIAIIRFYPAVPKPEVAVLVRTALWTQGALVGMIGAIVFLLAHMIWTTNNPLQYLVSIGLLIFIFQSIFMLLANTLRARLLASIYSLFMIWAKAVGVGLGILFVVYFRLGESGILWGIVIGVITALPFLFRKAFINVQIIGPVSVPLLREMACYSIPLTLANLSSWILRQSDLYLIQLFYSSKEVGTYSVVYSISEYSIRLLTTLFMISSGPLLINIWEKQGEGASKRIFVSVTRLYLIVGVPVVAAMSALAEPTIKVLTGADFSDGYTIVPWVVGGVFFIGIHQRFNHPLQLLKRSQVIMLWVLAAGALNIALNWWLLPLLGYKIAAVNTLICYMFLCIGIASTSRRYFRWPFPWKTAMRSLLAASVIFGGIYLLTRETDFSPPWILALAVPIGMLAYGLSLWGLGEISPAEFKTLEESGRRYLTHLRTSNR
jgi:O-antigen/teichoic acid export membrane protein